jgi:hypothetical protein
MDDILGYPYENLAQSGYKPNMSYKSLIIVLYFGYRLEIKYRNLMIFIFIFSLALLACENPSKSLIFNFQSLKISCWQNFVIKEKAGDNKSLCN